MGLIDADKLYRKIDCLCDSFYDCWHCPFYIKNERRCAITKAFEHQPTVDAVEVLRCKDCKYFNGKMKFCDYSCQVKDDDYCSWGERREDVRITDNN